MSENTKKVKMLTKMLCHVCMYVYDMFPWSFHLLQGKLLKYNCRVNQNKLTIYKEEQYET